MTDRCQPPAVPGRSDWDAFACDERGNSTNGVSEPSACGVTVEITTNWLSIRQPSIHLAASPLPPPVIATVIEGEISIFDVTIVAARGPQDGIYFACWFPEADSFIGMVGVGCFGWTQPRLAPYVGVLPSSIKHLFSLIDSWAEANRIPRLFRTLSSVNCRRFNQGDAFVAAGAGIPLPSSVPGAAPDPEAVRFIQKGSARAEAPPELACQTAGIPAPPG